MNERGLTLIELVIAIGLVGLMAAIAFPRIGDALRKQSVRSARAAVVAMHAKARASAIQRARATAFVVSGNTVLVVSRHPVTGALDTIDAPENLQNRYGVTVLSTRDTLSFDPRGLGTQGEDTKITVTKGPYSQSIEINPLGRVLR